MGGNLIHVGRLEIELESPRWTVGNGTNEVKRLLRCIRAGGWSHYGAAFAELSCNDGRITCLMCGVVIGQVDVPGQGRDCLTVTEFYDHHYTRQYDGHMALEAEHFAPCGLPCGVFTADKSWVEANAPRPIDAGTSGKGLNKFKLQTMQIHHGEKCCPRCEPKSCPICQGSGGRARDRDGALRTNSWWEPCSRCNGQGRVPGKELWEAHD